MSNNTNILKEKLKSYKTKYYKNLIIKGLIFSLSLIIGALLLITFFEFLGHFNTTIRTALFYLYLVIIGYSTIKWIILPTYKLITIDKELSDKEAAEQIGAFFPEIKDKLLNTLQLLEISTSDNSLIAASIDQRSKQFSTISFSNAIDYKKNKRFIWRYFLAPASILLLILIFTPDYFTDSADRLVRHNEEIIPEAPFNFIVETENLNCFEKEDFELQVKIEGSSIPIELYLSLIHI